MFPRALTRRFPVLSNRNFRFLLADRLLAPMAAAFALVGVSFAVLQQTGSTADLSYVIAAQAAPSLVFLLVGGVIADRIAPQFVIIAANVMIAVGEGLFGILVLAGHPALWVMITLEVVTGTGVALFYPASTALLPRLVPAAQMREASAISRLGMNAATMAGSALAGECAALFGPGWALAACGVGMLGTVPLMLAIKLAPLVSLAPLVPLARAGVADGASAGIAAGAGAGIAAGAGAGLAAGASAGLAAGAGAVAGAGAGAGAAGSAGEAAGERAPNAFRELREGWSEFRSHTWLWATVLQYTVVLAAWCGAFQVLGPAVANAHLGGPAAWGMISAADAIGLIVGGFVALRFVPSRPIVYVVLIGAAIAVAPLSLAMLLPLPLILAAAFALGVGIELLSVIWTVTMAAKIPADKLARVSAYDALGTTMGMPAGALVAGPLAARFGVAATQYGAVAITLLASALALIPRDVRTMRSTSIEPDLAESAPAESGLEEPESGLEEPEIELAEPALA